MLVIQVILFISESSSFGAILIGCPLESIINRYVLPTNQPACGDHSESHAVRVHPVKRKPV